MMIDIESRVAESLHARADGPVRTGDLRTAAVARARTIRRRRAAAGSAGVLVAVATAGVLAVPSLLAGGDGGQSGSPGAGGPEPVEVVGTTGSTTLPELTGVPAAAEQPASVGTDPAVLHFDAYLAQLGAKESEWRSGPGYEGVTISRAADRMRMDLYIGPESDTLDASRPWPGPVLLREDGATAPLYEEGEPEQTTVDGRAATIRKVVPSDLSELDNPDALPPGARIAGIDLIAAGRDGHSWVLRWQPVDGLHAIVQVRGGDRALAFEVADALRPDRVQRCAVPLRLAALPTGAEWTGCRTALEHGPAGQGVTWAHSMIELTRPGSGEVLVYAEDVARARHPGDAQVVPNRVVAGYPAWWSTQSPAGLYVPEFGPAAVFIEGASEQVSAGLVEELTMVGDLDRPGTWPARAAG